MEIIYQLNKRKLSTTLIMSAVFILLGILFIIKPDNFASSFFARSIGPFGKPLTIQIIGIFTVLFFLLYSVGALNIFFSNYGLKITEDGFINNTSLTNAGLVLWEDIRDFKLDKGKLSTVLFIYVKDEKKYFKKIKNPLIRLNAFIYNKAYKISFVIDVDRLTISGDEIFEIFKKHTKS